MPSLLWAGVLQGTEGPKGTQRWRRDKLCLLELGCVSSPALGHHGSCFSRLSTLGFYQRPLPPCAQSVSLWPLHSTSFPESVLAKGRWWDRLASRSTRANVHNKSRVPVSVCSPIACCFFFSGEPWRIHCLLHLLKNKTQPNQFEDLLGFIRQFMNLAKSHPASTRYYSEGRYKV